MLLALVGGVSAVSSPPPPPPAPPCTVAMLKQRPAGDKSWPVACSQVPLVTSYEDLDLSGAHLSYGDFKGATFDAHYGSIILNGAGLAHADLSGSTLTADGYVDATIDFAGADLTNADLSGSTLTADGYVDATIDFAGADLTNADLSGAALDANGGQSFYSDETKIDFSAANLTNADLSGSALTATARYDDVTIDFTDAVLTNADLSNLDLTVASKTDSGGGNATIDFTGAGASLADANLSGLKLAITSKSITVTKAIKGLPPSQPPSPLPPSPSPPPPSPSPSPPSPSPPPPSPLPPSPSPPPPSLSSPSPSPPPTPGLPGFGVGLAKPDPSMERVMLELTASGSVSDYTDSDKSRLQQKVANAAGVDKSVVTIRVTAASVRITATVAVPASMTADQVRISLSSGLSTADAASNALGITVEEEPVITVIGSDSSSSGLGAPQIAGIAVGATLALVLLLAVCAFFTVTLRQEQNESGRVHKPGSEVPQAHETNHEVKVESV